MPRFKDMPRTRQLRRRIRREHIFFQAIYTLYAVKQFFVKL